MKPAWTCMKAAAALLIAASILSACGSKDASTEAAATGQQNGIQQGGGQQGGRGGFQQMAAPNQPDRQADLFAKIVSINGNSVVVQQADMGAMPQRGQQNGNQQGGQGQDGVQPAADGQAPSQGDAGQGGGQPPADGQAPQGGGQGGGMPNFFTGEQKTINIPDDAAIYKLVRGDDGSMNYEQIKLAELAADEIVNIWVKSGTSEAEYVSLRGGFGGGFGPRGGQGGGNQADNAAGNQTTTQ